MTLEETMEEQIYSLWKEQKQRAQVASEELEKCEEIENKIREMLCQMAKDYPDSFEKMMESFSDENEENEQIDNTERQIK